MAKVLKPGRIQRGWSKKFTCTGYGNEGGGCSATLLISEYDIYPTTSSAMGEVDHHLTFCCPQCGVETDIEDYSVDPKGKRPSEKERKRIGEKNMKRKKPAD